ncbi:MAG TPA: sigma-70 family RNA polymerase sigma factor [Acidimicrobiales bacterium]
MHDVAAVVQRAAGGDADAWSELVRQFAGLVWSTVLAHGLSQSDADDVAQMTWLRLAEHLHRLRDPDRVGLWLATTARNEAMRVAKRGRREILCDPLEGRFGADGGNGGQSASVDTDLLAEERDRSLWRAFSALSSPCKTLLLLLTNQPDLSYREVSLHLGMPVGSIGPTRNRCLERLRRNAGLVSHVSDGPRRQPAERGRA